MKYAKYFIPVLIVLAVIYFIFERKESPKPEGVFKTIGEYFSISKDKIDKIEITRDAARLTIAYKDNAWFVESPVRVPAEKAVVVNLIKTVLDNPLHRVIPENEVSSLSEYGLENPTMSITLYTADEPVIDLKMGEENVSQTDLYAKHSGRGDVLLTAVQLVSNLNLDPNSYRAKKPLTIDEASVEKLIFRYPEKSFTVEKNKESGTWYVKEPFQCRANGAKISMLLQQLKSMEIVKFLNEKLPDDNAHGLTAPVVTIEISSVIDNSASTVTMSLGDTSVGDNAVYARLSTSPDEDFLVEASIQNKLMVDENLIRENSLFIFEMKQIESIEVREKGSTNLTIMQTKGAEWKMISPENAPVDQASLNRFMESLANLRPSAFIPDKDLANLREEEVRFESYTVKIEVKTFGVSEKYAVTIGAKKDKSFYAKTSDSSGAYLLDEPLVKKFFEATKAIKGF